MCFHIIVCSHSDMSCQITNSNKNIYILSTYILSNIIVEIFLIFSKLIHITKYTYFSANSHIKHINRSLHRYRISIITVIY